MAKIFKVKKIATGYYVTRIPVTLHLHGGTVNTTAEVEIVKREDGSGWSYTIEADGHRLSTHEAVYERKRDIVPFLTSSISRHWTYYTEGGLNDWVLGKP